MYPLQVVLFYRKAVSDFELELANHAGSNYAVGVGNATDGMEIFLEAIGVNPGDELLFHLIQC